MSGKREGVVSKEADDVDFKLNFPSDATDAHRTPLTPEAAYVKHRAEVMRQDHEDFQE